MDTDATPNAAQPTSRRRWNQFSLCDRSPAAVVLQLPLEVSPCRAWN